MLIATAGVAIPPCAVPVRYTARSGSILTAIARRAQTSLNVLLAIPANRKSFFYPSRIRRGETVVLPASAAPALRWPASTGGTAAFLRGAMEPIAEHVHDLRHRHVTGQR